MALTQDRPISIWNPPLGAQLLWFPNALRTFPQACGRQVCLWPPVLGALFLEFEMDEKRALPLSFAPTFPAVNDFKMKGLQTRSSLTRQTLLDYAILVH